MSESKLSTARVVGLGVALVCFGALGFHAIPGMIAEDAPGNKWINAVYCSVITLTTVGFGDICPGEIAGLGKAFIVLLALSGLGMFCGPILDLASSWKRTVPMGGRVALMSSTIAMSIFLFSYLLEEMTESEAAYFSIIIGTTIGYGDIKPKSDAGKLAVALYAILAVNVVASLLEPAKEFLLGFCMVPVAPPSSPKKKSQEIASKMAKKAKKDK